MEWVGMNVVVPCRYFGVGGDSGVWFKCTGNGT